MLQQTILALSDPTRREILKILKRGNRTAGEISERFDVSAPAISRHLSVLRDAGLIAAQREGKFLIYSLYREPLEALDDWINEFLKEDL
ncbi:MAG: winged helix-turn-helix transcriptional regulator [Clostridia bacterium]|nr:winged helix-turn-helix transcriptional regulator [Clostridia bacterium]